MFKAWHLFLAVYRLSGFSRSRSNTDWSANVSLHNFCRKNEDDCRVISVRNMNSTAKRGHSYYSCVQILNGIDVGMWAGLLNWARTWTFFGVKLQKICMNSTWKMDIEVVRFLPIGFVLKKLNVSFHRTSKQKYVHFLLFRFIKCSMPSRIGLNPIHNKPYQELSNLRAKEPFRTPHYHQISRKL